MRKLLIVLGIVALLAGIPVLSFADGAAAGTGVALALSGDDGAAAGAATAVALAGDGGAAAGTSVALAIGF